MPLVLVLLSMKGTLEMAFLLTILAGLSTGIGSLIAFLIKDQRQTNYLTFAMSFAAGVMLFVSFVEILPHAVEQLEAIYSKEAAATHTHEHSGVGAHEHTHDHDDAGHFGHILATICFFAGMLLVALIDKLIPKVENPHELISKADMETGVQSPANKARLMRIGLLSAIALGLHNFPEGIATFTAALNDVNMGITIAIAIALHNIPEGIAVSMPIYFATGSRAKAFGYSFLSGLVEPLGAFAAYFLASMMGFNLADSSVVMAAMLAGVAGIMVFISLDQLLPAAEEYGHHHLSTYGVVSGMAVMAASLLLVPH